MLAFGLLAIGMHAALLGVVAGLRPIALGEQGLADSMSIRTIEMPAPARDDVAVVDLKAPTAAGEPPAAALNALNARAAPAAPKRTPARTPRPIATAAPAASAAPAVAPSAGAAVRDEQVALEPVPPPPDSEPLSTPPDASTRSSSEPSESTASSVFGTPPPTYRATLPPPVTLRYEVRRGFLRGTGEIRWQPAGERYALSFDARIGGLSLLMQTSEGAIDAATGLAPVRFVDQRVRRSPQAANFDRDTATIAFSGPSKTYPLLPGSQDRLSLFIQLAGIAAADPDRLVDGATISIVVVGARGDAAVWQMRVAGRETVETAAGTVNAVKIVREPRHAGDTGAEIWLDPDRHWLPAHATLRNASGASEYDLLLEGMSSGP